MRTTASSECAGECAGPLASGRARGNSHRRPCRPPHMLTRDPNRRSGRQRLPPAICQDLLPRRARQRPASAAASTASEEGSGVTAAVITVKVAMAPTLPAVRMKLPLSVGNGSPGLGPAISDIGPIGLASRYIANDWRKLLSHR